MFALNSGELGSVETQGVRLVADCGVTELDHRMNDGQFVVTGVHYQRSGGSEFIVVKEGNSYFCKRTRIG